MTITLHITDFVTTTDIIYITVGITRRNLSALANLYRESPRGVQSLLHMWRKRSLTCEVLQNMIQTEPEREHLLPSTHPTAHTIIGAKHDHMVCT